MKPNELKIINLLILNALNRQDYSDRNSFKDNFVSLLKEIEDSINLFLEEENLDLSEENKTALIQNAVEAFISKEVETFYSEIKSKSEDSGWSREYGSKGYFREGSFGDSSDDPLGPNF